jgi:hypothetical protein
MQAKEKRLIDVQGKETDSLKNNATKNIRNVAGCSIFNDYSMKLVPKLSQEFELLTFQFFLPKTSSTEDKYRFALTSRQHLVYITDEYL